MAGGIAGEDPSSTLRATVAAWVGSANLGDELVYAGLVLARPGSGRGAGGAFCGPSSHHRRRTGRRHGGAGTWSDRVRWVT
jgi:hypothetical protein